MKHQADRKKEKGIALLLTLGIMALLLISAMSFSFQALTDRMAAANNANATRARLLARGGLERAIGALKFRCDGGESPDPLTAMSYPENLYPGTATTKALFATPKDNIWGANRYFWCSTNPTGQTRDQFGLETALAVDLDFAYTPSYATQVAVGDPSTTLADRASWQHVSMSETSVGRDLNGDGDTSDSVLTGRFSFLAIDDSGKLDPGSLITPAGEPYIDTNGNGSYTAGEFYLDYNQNGSYTSGTGINEATPGALPRFGWSPEEICLDYDEFRTDAPAGATDWFSWKHLTELPWSLSSTSSALATYSPHNDSIIDAYRNAGDTTDYQRMNLWDIDWDTTDWTNATNFGWLSSTARDFYSNPATKTINAQASPGDADGGAPWLGLSGTNVSTQVKLNLIDFCDTDSAASVYTDETSGDTCYGLEKVPYINEVGVTAVYSHIEFLGSTILAQVIVTVNVELVNIYDEDILIQPSSCDLTLDVDGTTRTITVPIDDGSGNAITVTKNSYAIFSFSDNYNVNNGAATNDPVTVALGDCTTTVNSSTSDLADYAYFDFGRSASVDGGSPTGTLYYAASTVGDPRVNTIDGDWTKSTFDKSISGNITMGAVNTNNPDVDPSAGSDKETVTDPALGISTAYIPNLPPLTLWELGAIHRGIAWETLNFTKWSATNSGYAAGDAELLNQMKLGSYTVTRGRVNPNTLNTKVWTAIFEGVVLGASYAAPTDDTPPAAQKINFADAGTMAGVAQLWLTAGNRFTSRAGIADPIGVYAATLPTDRQQEELVGKIVQLLSVRQNIFTFIVTSQSLKDMGDNVHAQVTTHTGASSEAEFMMNRNWVRYDKTGGSEKYAEVMAEQKVMATVYRNAFTNEFRILTIEYLE